MADGFLGRWSRRKQEVREGKPVEEPPALVPVPAPATAPSLPTTARPASVAAVSASEVQGAAPQAAAERTTPAAEPSPALTLADAQALTPASDFSAFVARDVSPDVRNLAMKKLFADPHYNVMDGLDIYIGDYTQADPLPEGMLRKMASAHAMGFFDHEKNAEAEAGIEAMPVAVVDDATTASPAQTPSEAGADGEPDAIAPAIAQPRDDAEGEAPPVVAQSQICNAIPSAPTSELGMATPSAQEAVAVPASHIHNDHDAHLRLQQDDAPQREGVGRGTA